MRKPVAIEGGDYCPKCQCRMQRYEHSPCWQPQPGKCWFRFWDRCEPCGHTQHYPAAKVLPDVSAKAA